MTGYVAILEDDHARVAEMRVCLAEILPAHEPVLFDDAAAMIAWLRDHLGEVVLISLDHDLPITRGPDGRVVDRGDGRMVADFLATQAPTCPVIVHTSNHYAGPGVTRALSDAGWQHCRVCPRDDVQWVRGAWLPALRDYAQRGWIFD